MRLPTALRTVSAVLLIGGLTFMVGCDSSTTGPDLSTKTIEGTVTDEDGYGKRAGSVEGAAVTAVGVTGQAETHPLDGSAQTDASGHYELEVSEPTTSVIVRAEGENDFQAQTLVHVGTDGSQSVRAMPMNGETSAEADVYVEARQDGGDAVTKSDVALYVDEELAGEIEEGGTTVAEIAQSIRARVEAEHGYAAESEDGEERAEEGRSNKVAAFATLQSELSASSSADARANAIARVEEAMIEAYTDAGVSADVAAQARLAGHSALDLHVGSAEDSSDALFGLRKRSTIVATTGLARAIEASFEAEGAAQSRLETLAEAHTTLVNELRAATTAEAMAQARADFESTVEAELASEIGVNASTIDSARAEISGAKTTLDSALSIGTSVSGLVGAHATFFNQVTSTLRSQLETSGNAELGASVIALLSVH